MVREASQRGRAALGRALVRLLGCSFRPLCLSAAALFVLANATVAAKAVCGELGGPGYRGPNGKCVGWEAIGRVCGSPPTTRCTPEQVASEATDAARDGGANQDRKNRAHDALPRSPAGR